MLRFRSAVRAEVQEIRSARSSAKSSTVRNFSFRSGFGLARPVRAKLLRNTRSGDGEQPSGKDAHGLGRGPPGDGAPTNVYNPFASFTHLHRRRFWNGVSADSPAVFVG